MLIPVLVELALDPAPSPSPAPTVAAAGVTPGEREPRPSREAAASRSSRAEQSRGPLPSLYRGRYYRAGQETFRLCVAAREGSNVYTVRGGGGDNYYGTYQFHRDFQRGAAYMMAGESRVTHDGLRADALDLRYVPINRWSRYWQDRAFYTVLNYRGDWSGKGHWAGGRWTC